ncbi:MAG: hypothetical protein ACI9C4_002324 [Paraglaciecola sp.]|jgi:uncharacterized protein YbaR (Trm112 family)
MAFDKKLLEIIACPVCKGALYYDVKNSRLVCKFDRLAYAIEQNIPILLESEAMALSSDELQQIGK